MNQFYSTAQMNSLKGTITCTPKIGPIEYGLVAMLDVLDFANTEIANSKRKTLPCIVQEGTKVVRVSETNNYHQKVYVLNFSTDPDPKGQLPMEKKTFYETLLSYANYIGKDMEQVRLYLDFDGKTELLETDI